MRFVLQNSVLNGRDAVLTRIDKLVDRASDRLHRLEVADADLLMASLWYQRARPTRQKLLTTSAKIPPRRPGRQRGPHFRLLEVHDAATAAVAERLAYAPLTILVEDRESDGRFLDILIEELGWPEFRALWDRARTVTPRGADYANSGGSGSLPIRVKRAAADAQQEGRPPRVIVLSDSDRRWPGDSQSATALDAIRAACEAHKIVYHIWEKRAVENYIPDDVFRELHADPRRRKDAHRIAALLRRSPAQRDYLPLRQGLQREECQKATVAGLYSAEEAEDLELLKERLFPKRPRPLLLLSAERRFAFTAEGLRRRDSRGELDLLLEAISREL